MLHRNSGSIFALVAPSRNMRVIGPRLTLGRCFVGVALLTKAYRVRHSRYLHRHRSSPPPIGQEIEIHGKVYRPWRRSSSPANAAFTLFGSYPDLITWFRCLFA